MNDSDFDDLLRSARGESSLPKSFRQEVWRRVENDAAATGTIPLWYRIFTSVAKPWGAATGLAATVALGLWLGTITASKEEPSPTAYAYSISPFAQTHH
jgi:hypothetical protein